jgi:hypothetical protein
MCQARRLGKIKYKILLLALHLWTGLCGPSFGKTLLYSSEGLLGALIFKQFFFILASNGNARETKATKASIVVFSSISKRSEHLR